MSKELRFREADFQSALKVAENLRPEDVRELETATGLSATEAVFRSLAASDVAYAGFLGDDPHSLWGFTADPSDPSVGVLWLVGTSAIDNSRIATFKASRDIVQGLLKHRFNLIWNYADSRNPNHMGWLKMLGFERVGARWFNGVLYWRVVISNRRNPDVR